MQRRVARLLAGMLVLGAAAGVGCSRPDTESGRAALPDSLSDSAAAVVNGVSREEIQQKAEAMTPEQAERLGIVDTTIKVEDPSDDSARLDSARRAGPDSAR